MGAAIARAFVEARRTGAVIAAYPGDAPAALDDAYRIQDAGIALTQHRIGGWKVGRVAPALVDEYGSERIAGPIFAHRIVEDGEGATPAVPVLAGFAAVEAELLLRIAHTPLPGLTLDAARDCIDEVRFGLEVASSPFTGINDHGPAVTVSDFGNNFGLVLGPRIADWRSRDLLAAPVALAIDGAAVGQGTLAAMLDGPFGALCFLTDSLARRGLRLEPGQWVSTGAITGVHRIAAGQRASATFDGAFTVACDTVAYAGDAA